MTPLEEAQAMHIAALLTLNAVLRERIELDRKYPEGRS